MKKIVAASLAVAALAAGAGTVSAAEPGEYQLYHDRYSARYYSYGYAAPAYGYYDYGPSVGFSIGFGPRAYYW